MLDIRRRYPKARLYFYTAWFDAQAIALWELCDGLQFTIHPPASNREERQLLKWQQIIDRSKSCRLRIDSRVKQVFPINRGVWADIQICKWLTEAELRERHGPTGLPQDERLFLYEEAKC